MILIDTNIISTFAKVDKLDLLFAVLNRETLFISPSVFEELRVGRERGYLSLNIVFEYIEEKKIAIIPPTDEELLLTLEYPPSFNSGELECLAIAQNRNGTIITNEKKVINYCKEKNIKYLTLHHILKALWKLDIISKEDVSKLMDDIERKDRLTIVARTEILED